MACRSWRRAKIMSVAPSAARARAAPAICNQYRSATFPQDEGLGRHELYRSVIWYVPGREEFRQRPMPDRLGDEISEPVLTDNLGVRPLDSLQKRSFIAVGPKSHEPKLYEAP